MARSSATSEAAEPTVPFTRRLRAVTVIDVVGYSRLMAAHEGRTHARVNALFAGLVEPAIVAHGGRRIERAGDGLIVLFESSTDAVRCALAIQRSAGTAAHAGDAAQRLQMRIGINVGDIIIDGDEIAGDDVNIAVRLQSLAEPGTVCISAAVRSQLHEELNGTFEDLGDVKLKNIGRPVRVYQLRDREGPALVSRFVAWRFRRFERWRVPGALAGIVALCSLWWFADRPTSAPRPAVAAPPMSVAVLPFTAASGVDGAITAELAADIRRGLTATGWLRVAGARADDAPSARAGAAAGADALPPTRYAVHGRLTPVQSRWQADVGLLDTAQQLEIWTTRIAVEARPSGVDDLSLSLVVKLREAIYDAESRRLLERGGKAESAMDYKMLGDLQRVHYPDLGEERTARGYYEQSLALDPAFVPSIISLAYTLLWEIDLDPGTNEGALLDRLEQLSRRAVAESPDSAPAWQLRSEALARRRQWVAAIAASDKSLSLDAGRAIAFGQRAGLLVRLGRPEEALEATSRALSLTEKGPGYVYLQRCRALMGLGQQRAAAEACELSVAREDWWMTRAYLSSAYARTGDVDKAAAEKRELLRERPGMTVRLARDRERSGIDAFDRQLEANLLQGLRSAGLAERE